MASKARTTGAAQFDPDALFEAWSQHPHIQENDLKASITQTFDLPQNDSYVYHAIASVTLTQVQQAINHGSEAGLHAWYRDHGGKPLPPPSPSDISAYTSIFASNTVTNKALTGFASNAKKGSIREKVAAYLQFQRLMPSSISIPRLKNHVNPYFDYWYWSCQNLEWAGPEEGTASVKMSHHILPIFMHHFGCVVPSYESLEIIKQVAQKRTVLDLGSGNGYWTFILRRQGMKVDAVDNLQSIWRTLWIDDTIVKDGDKYLKEAKGGKDAVLLLVYPIVGADFTAKVIDAYKGNTICVAGTQNRSGYTAFKDKTIDEYMEQERKEYEKKVQIPLPSFAGKDEALFVFERKQQ